MARPSKDGKHLNCILSIDVAIILDKFIEDTGLSKTATVEKALKEYIEKYNKTKKI